LELIRAALCAVSEFRNRLETGPAAP
jgi:hypothetical protein